MSRFRGWLFVLVSCLIFPERAPAKVVVANGPATPTLINNSFEEPGTASDQAAGWGRWGDWFNREEQWIPVHSGHCILGYHHWEIPNANDSGVYQDITNAIEEVQYTFGIFANVDKASPPASDALSIELRLECLVDGQPQPIASKSYPVAKLTPGQWEKLTVSGTAINSSLRVLVIASPSSPDVARGGAIRFDDAFLAPAASVEAAIPKSSPQALTKRVDVHPYGNAIVIKDIPYARIDPHQNLDLYLPASKPAQPPVLVVWIHGGAWMLRNKDWNNVKYLVSHGFALASVDYRLSGEATFPAQIRDCNAALDFLLANAGSYGFSSNQFIVGGASAGGHLALLLGLARDEQAFAANPSIKPLAILDFFGPTDLATIVNEMETNHGRQVQEDAVQRLLGGPLSTRTDLARVASPLQYVKPGAPPVLILHGDQDDLVPYVQSQRLHSLLDQTGVKNELLIVTGAGHDGPKFETLDVQKRVLNFLHQILLP